MRISELANYWDDLRDELLDTRDPRKVKLVEVMDDVMDQYRAKVSASNGYPPDDDDLLSCDDCSANAM
jgi:hypothetical protein